MKKALPYYFILVGIIVTCLGCIFEFDTTEYNSTYCFVNVSNDNLNNASLFFISVFNHSDNSQKIYLGYNKVNYNENGILSYNDILKAGNIPINETHYRTNTTEYKYTFLSNGSIQESLIKDYSIYRYNKASIELVNGTVDYRIIDISEFHKKIAEDRQKYDIYFSFTSKYMPGIIYDLGYYSDGTVALGLSSYTKGNFKDDKEYLKLAIGNFSQDFDLNLDPETFEYKEFRSST